MLRSGVHITGPARRKLGAELKRAYSSGASVRVLAHGCGRSYGFVYRVLTEAGTVMRTRGGANNRHTASPRGREQAAEDRGRPSGGSR